LRSRARTRRDAAAVAVVLTVRTPAPREPFPVTLNLYDADGGREAATAQRADDAQ
jgi:hypothetical protein